MTFKPTLRLILLCGSLVISLPGQSVLERYGFGQVQPVADVVGQGMGGISVLPIGRGKPNFALPASWYLVPKTRFQAGLRHNEVRPEAGGFLRRDFLQEVQFLAHLTNREAFGIGMRPLTRVDLLIRDTTGTALLGEDSLRFNQQRRLTGGISAFRVGYSRRLNDQLSLGLSLDLIFGTITQADTATFTERDSRGDLPLELIGERRLEFTGKAIGLSLLWDKGAASRSVAGMQLQLPLNLAVIIHAQSTGMTSESMDRQKDVGLPYEARFGYAYSLSDDQLILGEIGFTALPDRHDHRKVFEQYLERTGEFRLGWSKTPREDVEIQPGRLYYRVGFSYRRYYLSGSNTEHSGGLNEFSLTAGIGFRSWPARNRLDLAVQYGTRSGSWPELQERFLHLSIGVTTGEMWFMRPKKKWD